MTQTEPLLGVYLKAINDTFEALSFSKFKKNKLDVDTFKDLVLEYAMIRGSKFPVSNLEILLKSIMTSSPSFMAFNNISKLLSLVFFKPLSLSPSQSLGLTGNFEPRIIALTGYIQQKNFLNT
jgi:hypothetical protein